MMSFDALRDAVAAGEIDTVVVAFPDMAGQLIGKRFQAEYFLAPSVKLSMLRITSGMGIEPTTPSTLVLVMPPAITPAM